MEEKPRKLTDDEILDILSVIPEIKSAAKSVSLQNTKSMKVLVREQLKEIELTPLGISDLKAEIIRQFEETVARPGSMVGLTTAESLGKPITQLALNSFHTSGAAKNVSTGVERIEELLNVTKNPKKTSCTIYFKEQSLSFEDIITKKRLEITEITVKDLVIDADIEDPQDFVDPEWYSYYRSLIRNDFQSTDVLRLRLDINLLYAYKLTMEDICSVIENEQPVICVYSPMPVGKIDIYPIENLIISKLRESKIDIIKDKDASLTFLSGIIIPNLDKLRISGISGIKQIYPADAGIWQIVKEEQRIENLENGWYLILNPIRMKATGITVEKLIKLVEILKMKVLKIRENYIAVTSEISPTKVLQEALDKDSQEGKLYEKQKREEGARIMRRPPTEISINSVLTYAESTGSNLKELLIHPEIDSTRTYCNNIHEINDSLGIEAARNFLIKEFIDLLIDDSYINIRHIILLADFICSLGKPYGLTSTGVSRQPIGALEKASFEKAMKHFKEASAFGEERSVSGTSASVFIGKKAMVGTGYSDLYIRPENLKRYHETRKELNSDPNFTLDIDAFNSVIKIESETDLKIMAEQEEMFAEITPIAPIAPSQQLVTELGKVQPSQISTTIIPSSPNLLIKPKTIRSAELEESAELLRTAPCLRPPKAKEEAIIALEELPKKIFPEFPESGRPSISLPPISLPPISKFPSTSKPKQVTKFNIDEFLK